MNEASLDVGRVARTNVRLRVQGAIESHPLLSVFLVAFVARIVCAFVAGRYLSGSFVFDDSTYSHMAYQASNDLSHRWDLYTRNLFRETATFLVPLTAIYEVLGPVKLGGQLFVALFGAGTAVLVTKLASEFVTRRAAIAAGFVVALLPSQVLWSSLVMKDALVWFFVAAVGLAVAIANRSDGRRLIVAGLVIAVLVFLLGYLRLHSFVVAIWAMAIASFFGVRRHSLFRIGGALLIGALVPLLVGLGPFGIDLITDAGSLAERRANNAVGASSAIVEPPSEEELPPIAVNLPISELNEFEEEAGAVEEDIHALDRRAAQIESRLGVRLDDFRARLNALRTRASALGEGIRIEAELLIEQVRMVREAIAEREESLRLREEQIEIQTGASGEGSLDADIAHLPRGLSVMILEPYPWQPATSAAFNLAKGENLLWYPVLLLAVIGLPGVWWKYRALVYPVLYGGGILVAYALTEGNVGTAIRHRGEFVWVVTLLFALGVVAVRRRFGATSEEIPSLK